VARVPEIAHGKISLACHIHGHTSFVLHFFCLTNVCILWRICVHIRVSDCIETVCDLPFLPNNTASWTFFTLFGSRAKCWLDIYHWVAGLVVTGWVCNTGQNVLQSFYQTRSVAAQIFFLIAFLETFVRNMIITLRINYTIIIIICISDNNTVITT